MAETTTETKMVAVTSDAKHGDSYELRADGEVEHAEMSNPAAHEEITTEGDQTVVSGRVGGTGKDTFKVSGSITDVSGEVSVTVDGEEWPVAPSNDTEQLESATEEIEETTDQEETTEEPATEGPSPTCDDPEETAAWIETETEQPTEFILRLLRVRMGSEWTNEADSK